MHGILCVVRACACDYRDPVVYLFNSILDRLNVLFVCHCSAFAGGTANDDSICAVVDVEIYQLAQLVEVDRAVSVHRCRNGNACACENGILHRN